MEQALGEYLLSKLGEKDIYAFDQDQNTIDNAQKRLAPIEKGIVTFVKGQLPSFAGWLQGGWCGSDGICYDLEVSVLS